MGTLHEDLADALDEPAPMNLVPVSQAAIAGNQGLIQQNIISVDLCYNEFCHVTIISQS